MTKEEIEKVAVRLEARATSEEITATRRRTDYADYIGEACFQHSAIVLREMAKQLREDPV